ncbi:MAG: PucR family transcriptional regulator [Eubacteriales bacterium]
MLNKRLQDVIYQMKDAVDGIIGIIDDKGIIISCNQPMKIGESLPIGTLRVPYTLDADHDIIVSDGYTYRLINPDYAVFAQGEDLAAEKFSLLLAIALNNILNLYNENYDKNTFIKNIILDNIPSGNIFIKANDLNIKTDVIRTLFLIKDENNSSMLLLNMLKSMFYENDKDFIFTINEQDIVLVYEIKQKNYYPEIEDIAIKIVKTISSKYETNVRIGISDIIYDLKDIAHSFQEAQTALQVGKIFDSGNDIVYYEKLGIGRLIYQLPTTLCEMYLDEILNGYSIDLLKPETLNTIECFFENNLNVLETSRKLFIHRNTLVYRLDKVRKTIGLDLNNYEQAITFKIALMIKTYLNTLQV